MRPTPTFSLAAPSFSRALLTREKEGGTRENEGGGGRGRFSPPTRAPAKDPPTPLPSPPSKMGEEEGGETLPPPEKREWVGVPRRKFLFFCWRRTFISSLR